MNIENECILELEFENILKLETDIKNIEKKYNKIILTINNQEINFNLFEVLENFKKDVEINFKRCNFNGIFKLRKNISTINFEECNGVITIGGNINIIVKNINIINSNFKKLNIEKLKVINIDICSKSKGEYLLNDSVIERFKNSEYTEFKLNNSLFLKPIYFLPVLVCFIYFFLISKVSFFNSTILFLPILFWLMNLRKIINNNPYKKIELLKNILGILPILIFILSIWFFQLNLNNILYNIYEYWHMTSLNKLNNISPDSIKELIASYDVILNNIIITSNKIFNILCFGFTIICVLSIFILRNIILKSLINIKKIIIINSTINNFSYDIGFKSKLIEYINYIFFSSLTTMVVFDACTKIKNTSFIKMSGINKENKILYFIEKEGITIEKIEIFEELKEMEKEELITLNKLLRNKQVLLNKQISNSLDNVFSLLFDLFMYPLSYIFLRVKNIILSTIIFLIMGMFIFNSGNMTIKDPNTQLYINKLDTHCNLKEKVMYNKKDEKETCINIPSFYPEYSSLYYSMASLVPFYENEQELFYRPNNESTEIMNGIYKILKLLNLTALVFIFGKRFLPKKE